MVDRTHRHRRAFLRCLTKQTLFYTEMLTTGAILNGVHERVLGFSAFEGPVALQLGGDDPEALSRCAELGQAAGYVEINLNVGCPSERVQAARFGACLMAFPERVAACVEAMRAATDLPVTVKHRIGIDEADSYEDMRHFVATVAAAGAQRVTVHARKAWLQGLSPKQNREVPPLRYDDVYRLKSEVGALPVEINGGVRDLDQVAEHLRRVDAVMIGRAALDDPWILADADRRIFAASNPASSRADAVRAHLPYIEEWLGRGLKFRFLVEPLLQLFAGQPGGRAWRRTLSESGRGDGAGVELVAAALEAVAALYDAKKAAYADAMEA
jgi:tRNA-dihydrouridine synthase A